MGTEPVLEHNPNVNVSHDALLTNLTLIGFPPTHILMGLYLDLVGEILCTNAALVRLPPLRPIPCLLYDETSG